MTAANTIDDGITLQGHYAGGVSRLAAFAIDITVSWSVYVVALAVVGYATGLIFGHTLDWSNHRLPWLVGLVAWQFVYFAYPWAVSGKSFGMAVLGLRVVKASGAPAGPRQAVIRTLTLPLSFLIFGLGFVGIVVGRERRALHDLFAGTAVVYAWDARAARLRFMARSTQVPGGVDPG